jgi:hypothetical protein
VEWKKVVKGREETNKGSTKSIYIIPLCGYDSGPSPYARYWGFWKADAMLQTDMYDRPKSSGSLCKSYCANKNVKGEGEAM